MGGPAEPVGNSDFRKRLFVVGWGGRKSYEGKGGWGMKLTTLLHPGPRLRNCGVTPPLFMA
jgi:hypothetical protein